jgi:hypothetical protein
MRQVRLVSFIVAAFLMPAAAQGALLQSVSSGSWTIGGITDGTSNTILFGETGSLDICVPDDLLTTTITDGSSQTLLFGEQGFVVTVSGSSARTGGTTCLTNVRDPRPVGGITDGTSNTILIGETPVDLCFSDVRVGTIRDGSSNTIQFEETVANRCYQDVQVGPGLVVQPVPAPAVLTLLACGLGVATWRRRRGR